MTEVLSSAEKESNRNVFPSSLNKLKSIKSVKQKSTVKLRTSLLQGNRCTTSAKRCIHQSRATGVSLTHKRGIRGKYERTKYFSGKSQTEILIFFIVTCSLSLKICLGHRDEEVWKSLGRHSHSTSGNTKVNSAVMFSSIPNFSFCC